MIKINKDKVSIKGDPFLILEEFINAIYNFKNIDWDNSLPIEVGNVVTEYVDNIKDPMNLLANLGVVLKEIDN